MLIWEEPPPKTSRRKPQPPGQYAEMRTELLARQGEWALLRTGEPRPLTALAHRIRTGKAVQFRPSGAFEAEAGPRDNGTWGLWARYVGGQLYPRPHGDPELPFYSKEEWEAHNYEGG